MKNYLENLNLIDLISEKHLVLRKTTEEAWQQVSTIEISHTEAHLLARVNQESITIAKAAKTLNISRQAMHKCAKQLESRGYIEFVYKEGNTRDKFMILTDLGKAYCKQSNELKEKLEQQIAEEIGQENVSILKECLKKSWVK
jgi:DNA-binding MarR family transcriptional regulator